MDAQITDLLGIIKEEVSLYRDLIEHTRKKIALLAQGRVDEILEYNKVEETYNIKLRFMENEMKRLCSEICRNLGIESDAFTLMDLADNLEKSAALEIKSQCAILRDFVMQLCSLTKRNTLLIEKSLGYSQGLLGLIANANSPYQQTGEFKPIPSIQPTFSERA